MMRLILAVSLIGLADVTVAHAAYPAGHPCLPTQKVDISGTYSMDPGRCPPSSHQHHFGQAYREEWIEGQSVAAGFGAPSPSAPASKGHGTIGGPGGRGVGGGGRGGHGHGGGHGGHGGKR